MSIAEPTSDVPENAVGQSAHQHQKSANSPCTHCGLPVPRGLFDPASQHQFCCGGCQTAYELIHSCGLDAYYSFVEPDPAKNSLQNRESGTTGHQFGEFDLPSFMDKFGKSISEDVNEITLLLDGIHCAACVWLIEKLPQIAPGIIDVKISWARQTVQVRWRPNEVQLSQVAKTLFQLGYAPHPIRENEKEYRRRRENRKHLIRIGIAAAAAGNNMLIAASLYLGMFSYMSTGMSQLLRVASCIVGLASLLWPGRVFLLGAANAIRTRTPHMDLPIAVGLTVGTIAGLVNTIRGSGEIYFDSLSVLIFLLLVGRWVQFRQQNRAADSVEMLYRLTPKTTRKMVDGQLVDTFVDLVVINDVLEIRSGELFPVDAIVIEGKTDVDESLLTGESRPRTKKTGDVVLAGTQNLRSAVQVRATATGREMRLSKIVEQVEQASLDKPQIVQWANRIGGIFVIAVIALAAVTFFGWLLIDASVAIDRSVALLIVACPCALALATPLAVSVALGRAAKQKIMIKGGDVLQLLDRPGMIWLDKTGTLTEGNAEVVCWHGESNWVEILGALETKSTHPIAKAIVRFAQSNSRNFQRHRNSYSISETTEQNSGGISGCVEGHQVLMGAARLLAQNGIGISESWQRRVSEVLKQNLSPCWAVVDGQIVAVIGLGDSIRAETQFALRNLKNAGWKIGILSGDHARIVRQVATRLGIAEALALGELTPEDKVKVIVESQADERTVVMVGDGVNDSAALAVASVGIAVHNGAEASLAAAPVYLAKEGLEPILELLNISRSTNKTIHKNFAASIGYNMLGATFAAIGFINPLVAAILMPISSLTVVAISLTAGSGKSIFQSAALKKGGQR